MADQPHDPQVRGDAARLLYPTAEPRAGLGEVARLAVERISACELCGVSVSADGRVTTGGASDAAATRLDEEQYRAGAGPCLTAIATGQPVRIAVVPQDARWPAFADRAAREGVGSAWSVPVRVGTRVAAALNLYAGSEPFAAGDEPIVAQLGDQAAAVLADAALVDQLQLAAGGFADALTTRDLVVRATGMIMVHQRCTSEAAFDVLRRVSVRRSAKLHSVAEELVRTGDLAELG